MSEVLIRALLAAPLAMIVVVVARWRGTLTRDGAVVAALVGTITVAAGGWWWGVLLLAFFAGSSAWSLLRLAPAGFALARSQERGAVQVIANGGIATISAAIGLVSHDDFEPARFTLFCGAVAAANADTWATEIGRFSRTAPRLVTTGRQVEPGVSGGITPLGTGGSVLGALLIGALAALGAALGWAPAAPWLLLAGTTIAGFTGSLVDSLLGASIQASYRERQSGQHTERRVEADGRPTELVRGIPWVTNDVVNLVASLTGAIAAVLIWWIAS